jgi:membrane protease YdiL (CAAX protease family)
VIGNLRSPVRSISKKEAQAPADHLTSIEAVSFLPQILRRFWSWLVPPRRNRLVPWSGLELIVVVFLTQYFWPVLVGAVLWQTDFFGWVYGPEFDQHMAQASEAPERKTEEYRTAMWRSVLCMPLNVATVLGVCGFLSGTRPYQLGLTTHRWGRNVLVGVLGAIVAAPLHILNVYLYVWYERALHAPPTQHPLTLIAQHPRAVDNILIVISAVVAAPLMEELLFRGFLQAWFSRRSAGGVLAVSFALVLALLQKRQELDAACVSGDWTRLGIALQPAAFVVFLAPGLLFMGRISRPDVARGIYGTAVLFAAAHSSIWPSPIPLLPLGLALGWLAYRTNSLVGPMVLHSLFNSIACVVMFSPYFR